MGLLLKYKELTTTIAAVLIFIAVFDIWLSRQKSTVRNEAVANTIRQVNQQANKRVQLDEIAIETTVKNVDFDAISARTERMFESAAKDSHSSQLSSVRGDPSNARRGAEPRSSKTYRELGAGRQLRDSQGTQSLFQFAPDEIEAILTNAHILQ